MSEVPLYGGIIPGRLHIGCPSILHADREIAPGRARLRDGVGAIGPVRPTLLILSARRLQSGTARERVIAYRGISRIRNTPVLGPYSSDLW